MKYHGRHLRKGRYSETSRHYIVTAVTHKRKPIFNHFSSARLLVNEFRLLSHSHIVDSLAWVIMPDHFHWLFVLNSTSISDVVRCVKGKSAYSINLSQNNSGQIWQKGFYDHALRKDEEIQAMARYIVANPLRAALVENIGDYPHWDVVWL